MIMIRFKNHSKNARCEATYKRALHYAREARFVTHSRFLSLCSSCLEICFLNQYTGFYRLHFHGAVRTNNDQNLKL